MEMFLRVYNVYIVNILDILIMTFIFYQIILIIRGTKAMQIVAGIAFLLIFTIIARNILHLRAVSWLLNGFWVTAVLIFAVAFQAEIRNMLAQVGGNLWFNQSNVKDKNVDTIVCVAEDLKAVFCGGLIAIENEIGLRSYTESGLILNADISKELLISIFKNKSSPLHDGAVIICNDKITAANCVLPLSANTTKIKLSGTRHRAALGLSEGTDAIIIVISEETGRVSIAYKGELYPDLSAIEVKEILVTKGKVLERK
ncbi:MAG: diadenylate cyclase CdaA [Elusimicrobiota bacterium]|jgi:diadenylate cyclase|nr:diadenylate cyclase CdaA [Elusimicrobiota bacterium]